jgi:hypothetical protein
VEEGGDEGGKEGAITILYVMVVLVVAVALGVSGLPPVLQL